MGSMATFNIHEAKTHFSRLLADVEAGREVVITRAGQPVAQLIPYQGQRRLREPGGWEGQIWIADDFDELPEEILAAFEGE